MVVQIEKVWMWEVGESVDVGERSVVGSEAVWLWEVRNFHCGG